eukprot:5406251-Amphidinium_carterae.1
MGCRGVRAQVACAAPRVCDSEIASVTASQLLEAEKALWQCLAHEATEGLVLTAAGVYPIQELFL